MEHNLILLFCRCAAICSHDGDHGTQSSACCLVFSIQAFFTSAGIWLLLLEAEFLALTLSLGLRRRGDGVIPIRGDDVGYQICSSLQEGFYALLAARDHSGCVDHE